MARQVISSGVYLGYDGVPNALRTSPDQKYQMWFNKPESWGTLRQESIEAAIRIREQTKKEIVVLYSGGLDSEWTLESFRLAKIPVTALVVEYMNGLNSHDIEWAKKYLAKTNHHSVIWHPFDLEAWYKTEDIKKMAWNVQTPELAYTAQFRSIIENQTTSRVFITSYDEPLIIADDTTDERKWNLTYSERHYSVVKFFDHYEVDGCSNWSRQNAKLFASYVTQPQWNMLAANLYAPMWWNSELIKIKMYQYSFPMLDARPKYTGFEQSLDFIVDGTNSWKEELKERLNYTWLQDSKEDIHRVWQKLGVNRRGD